MRKRAVSRMAGEGDEGAVVKRVAVGAVRPRACRTFARKQVAAVLPRIVEKFAQEAMQGSVAHAKALMTLGGLDRGEVEPEVKRRRGKSLARLLMERLEKSSAELGEGAKDGEGQ
jgi:hypothetical protein